MLNKEDFIWEESEVYHAQARECLSSHQLMSYIRSPYGYLRSIQNPKEFEPNCFTIGRAVHQFVLEGIDVFSKNYLVGGPINEKTGKPFGSTTQKFKDWQDELAANGKQGITTTDFDLVQTVNFSVFGHKKAAWLLDDGFPEAVVRTRYCDADCQIRIDWYNPTVNAIVDLKTCRNLDRFQFDFKEFMYANQLAFYKAVFENAFVNSLFGGNNSDRGKTTSPDVYIIATEVQEPFRTAVFKLSDGTLNEAKAQNEMNIPKFYESKKTGVYPTLYEEMRIL